MSSLTVFIVEDSPTIRQNLVDTLEELAPVKVVGTAETAREAIQALARAPEPCSLAVIDVLLRDGSGLEVLQALKDRRAQLHRVVLTNYATPAVRAHCLALGADRVFDKSGEIEDLVDYCNALAASAR